MKGFGETLASAIGTNQFGRGWHISNFDLYSRAALPAVPIVYPDTHGKPTIVGEFYLGDRAGLTTNIFDVITVIIEVERIT